MPTTWNPSDKSSSITLSGGNLVASSPGVGNIGVRSIDRVYTGKYYWEITYTTVGSINAGVADISAPFNNLGGTTASIACSSSGQIFLNNSNVATIPALTSGSVLCIALDLDIDQMWFRTGAAGNWNGNAANNPATSVGGINILVLSGAKGVYAVGGAGGASSSVLTANFGGSAFTGAVPAGFTSGFPSGTTLVNSAAVTQTALEQWAQGTPAAQVTQTAAEVWGGVSAASRSAILTQLALEEWAPVVAAVVATTAMQTAVCVNTG